MEPLRLLNIHGRPMNSSPKLGEELGQNAQKRALARPNFLRTITRVITLAVGASVLGALAHAAAVWYSTRNDILAQPHGVRMRGWPAQMDLTPTWVMLAAAVMAIVVQIIALLTLVGSVRRLRESNLHSWSIFVTSGVGIALWLAAAVYFKLQDNHGESNWTLWSWSCGHKDLVNGKMSFESMCVKMNFCFYTAVIVAALEIVSLVLFGLQLWKVKKEGGYSRLTVGK